VSFWGLLWLESAKIVESDNKHLLEVNLKLFNNLLLKFQYLLLESQFKSLWPQYSSIYIYIGPWFRTVNILVYYTLELIFLDLEHRVEIHKTS